MTQSSDRFASLPSHVAQRLRRAVEASSDASSAENWLASNRPALLRGLTSSIAAGYSSVENLSPPAGRFGAMVIGELDIDEPLRQTWPDTSIDLRRLMFRSTQLFRSLGVLVCEGGSDMTASLLVVGRTLLETLSHVEWVLECLDDPDPRPAARSAARRRLLLSLAGIADLVRESEDFDMPDSELLNELLSSSKALAAQLFGVGSVSLSKSSPRSWTIDGERLPSKRELVDRVGAKIFSSGRTTATHYGMPSSASHGSLGAPLGRFIPIDAADNVHTLFCVDVAAVEGWLWYYSVWYRFAACRMAIAHGWELGSIVEHDEAALALFGRPIASDRADPSRLV